MSEKVQPPKGQERAQHAQNVEAREQLDKLGEKLQSAAEKERSENKQSAEKQEARKSVEKHAISGKEHAPSGSEKASHNEPTTKGIKKQTYRATMRRVESRLPSHERVFSKVINNDTVDKVSAVAGRTVARPSALLGSSLVAFLGLGVTTFYAKQLGFEVPPVLFLVLLSVGWFAGIAVELVSKMFKRFAR